MPKFKKLSVLTGAVDETETLEYTVNEILRVCDTDDIEEIIILKAPHITPECEAVIEKLLKSDLPVPIFAPKQKGRGIGSLVEMFNIAKGSHCLLTVTDNAVDHSCIPQMIEKVKQNGDVIAKTSRWMPGCEFVGYSKTRHIMNYLGQKFLTLLFGKKSTDYTSPYQIAPTEVYKSIKWESEGFPILLELVLKPLRIGCEFIEIPTNCYGRTQGESSNSFRQTAKYFSTALHIRFMKKENILKK